MIDAFSAAEERLNECYREAVNRGFSREGVWDFHVCYGERGRARAVTIEAPASGSLSELEDCFAQRICETRTVWVAEEPALLSIAVRFFSKRSAGPDTAQPVRRLPSPTSGSR